MSSSNYIRSWIDRPHLDLNTRLLTEEYQRGITEFMGLVHRQPEAKTGDRNRSLLLSASLSSTIDDGVSSVFSLLLRQIDRNRPPLLSSSLFETIDVSVSSVFSLLLPQSDRNRPRLLSSSLLETIERSTTLSHQCSLFSSVRAIKTDHAFSRLLC
ncbi:hypothetical protein F2Q70_00029468 [Brassica cretica]|uniref:Uncharacterized protein n=1 Tax=Brassica cretica TaxID=69181 RepID=A0A8S9FDD3_BRACR|nr:hypothetical protein F2Q70_00029468 [Brassica cretica]